MARHHETGDDPPAVNLNPPHALTRRKIELA